jgi:nitroimidazol reductase NimA-like FMN-containing flavoprotein (pyridoxamine 5'-phosphate oxidase superfamily)
MLGELREYQVEELLKSAAVGRIGCHSGGITYIVPVNFVYEDSAVYAHSAAGMKIDMMRQNPEVCFQVDNIRNMGSWQSVIAWGRFEEITDLEEKQCIMQKLTDRIMNLMNIETNHPSHGITELESDIGTRVELIVYKIVLTRKTGRYEKREPKRNSLL